MSRRDDEIALRQMLDHAVEIVDLLAGKAREDLDNERTTELSVLRLLEVVGEAANRVSPEAQDQYSGIPWGEIVGLRNRLIHMYDAVDLDIVWHIVESDLPPLIKSLEEIIEEA